MTPDQLQRLEYLEGQFAKLNASDRYTVQKNIQMSDGRFIQVGTGTGTTIGTKASEKVGVHGKAVIQAGAINIVSTQGGTYDQTGINSIVASLNQVTTAIKNFGITA